MRIERDGSSVQIDRQDGDSRELIDIATSIMPEWLAMFSEKNREYGDNAKVLGLKGQFSDMWRKMGKLKKALWDEEELKFEGADEIIMDLIGHLFLTLQMMRLRDETDRAYAFGDMNPDQFVDRFIEEVGGAESALVLAGALSEGLRTRVTARCQQMAEERFLRANEPHIAGRDFDRPLRAGEPIMAKNLKYVEVAGKDVTDAFSNVEFMQSDAEQNGVGLGDVNRWLLKAGDIIRIEFSSDEFNRDTAEFVVDGVSGTGNKDQLQVFVGPHKEDDGCDEGLSREDIARSMADAETGSSSQFQNYGMKRMYNEFGQYEYEHTEPLVYRNADRFRRIVTELEGGTTRYYHEPNPGSDREPLALVPKRLVEQLLLDKATESDHLQKLAEWGFDK